MTRYKIPAERIVKQVRFLLMNKTLSYRDIERILKHNISFTTVREIHLKNKYPDVLGFEPPEEYESYYKSYCVGRN